MPQESGRHLCLRVRAALREMPELRAELLQLLGVIGAVLGQLLNGRLLGLVGLAVGVGRWVEMWLQGMELIVI